MPNKKAPRFQEAELCFHCKKVFSWFDRRHHCRHCGNSVCLEHVWPDKFPITKFGYPEKVLVCVKCGPVVIAEKRLGIQEDDDDGKHAFNFDMIVIGGGSGGLACSKEAGKLGMSVACCDFVTPSPFGTTWGLGGTCVNVGCIPKKLMHNAALLAEHTEDSKSYGWNEADSGPHTWATLVDGVQGHIKMLNKGYVDSLRSNNVKYFNALASFVDPHTLKLTTRDGRSVTKTARRIVIAVGGRPTYPDFPGAQEYCITSDDIFSFPRSPGKKVMVIGASYVALECAGFLTGLGYDVTVMVRSILLRGFDQDMAERIGKYMEARGTKFIRGFTPVSVSPAQDKSTSGDKYKVVWKPSRGDSKEQEQGSCVFDTVLVATGRRPCTDYLNLASAGVRVEKSGKIRVVNERTNVPHIYAIGDACAPFGINYNIELTPVAIMAGQYLSRRLYGGKQYRDLFMNFEKIATTVFTPLEYGAIGYPEDAAIDKFGEENIVTYHVLYQPLEMAIPDRMTDHTDAACYIKLVCDKSTNKQVVGFHILGPNAGEMTQGFATAMLMGATKADIDRTIGIHPTTAEKITNLTAMKSGTDELPEEEGC